MYLRNVHKKINWYRIIGLILFAFILIKYDIYAIFKTINNINLSFMLKLLFMVFILKIFQALRWRYLLHIQNYNLSIINSIYIYFCALSFGFITPARSGEFIKIFYLKEKLNMAYGEGVSNILIDKMLDFSVLFIFVLILLIFVPFFPFYSSYFFFLIELLIFSFFIIILYFRKIIKNKTINFLSNSLLTTIDNEVIKYEFQHFFRGLKKFCNIRLLIPGVGTILITTYCFLLLYILAVSMGISISFFYLAFCVSLSSIVAIIPVSISGIGTRDAVIIALFSRVGINHEEAVAFSILILFFLNIFTAIFGAVIFLVKPFQYVNKTKNI